MGKTVIIGIDGVPYSLMKDLSDRGVMKNFKKLREDGIFKVMKSSVPAVSSASWSTIITGENPGEHGIYGFTDMIKGSYTLSFSDFRNLRSPPFWEKNKKKSVIINVPSTYPPREMNGCHISGFVSPRIERSIYPSSYLEKLKEMDYKIDVDLEKAHMSKMMLFNELFDTLEKRKKAADFFWDDFDWDVFKFVITGSDRLGHFLWDAYEEKDNEHHQSFLKFFEMVDNMIGDIDSKLSKDDNLILISDHGMERVKFNVNLNGVLIKEGLLSLGGEKKKYKDIEKDTKAFAMEFGRLYINKKGKYPRGLVENEKEVRDNLIKIFNSLEIKGEKVIKEIHEKENIYRGKCFDDAPDLVLIPNKGFNLRGKITDKVFEESPFTGMHNPEAFLFVKGNKNKKFVPENPSVEDVVKIINKMGDV